MKADPGAVAVSAPRIARARASDFIELTKPKLMLLVLFTALAGFCSALDGAIPLFLLLHTLIGTALMAAGASAFNMFREQKTDALMQRTALRPVAAGRLPSRHALTFAVLISAAGLVYLYLLVNPVTSIVSAVILLSYLLLYTPLKARTWMAAPVGAIPGALPAVMGWSAASGGLERGAWVLFAIVFLWQMPHFCAIGWMYRDDYARAGLPVLSVVDSSGQRTGRQAVAFILALIPFSLLPPLFGMAGPAYAAGAAGFGLIFLGCGIGFAQRRTFTSARRLFIASALYLPGLFLLLVLDKLAVR